MRKLLVVAAALAVLTVTGLVLTPLADAAAVPAHHPTRLRHVGWAQQLVVVTGPSRTATTATLRTYQRGPQGWTEPFPAMAARIGYGGWVPAGSRVQDTGTTPQGTFRLSSAFGLAANPGARLPYTRADGDDYWVGDERDARTYNMFQPSASAKRTWRTGRAERLAGFPVQYEHAVVIDFNRPLAGNVRWDAAHSQWVTTDPVDVRRGSAIFLHVNGSGSTAGCVSVARADLLRVLNWLDPARSPRIVMAPEAEIGTA